MKEKNILVVGEHSHSTLSSMVDHSLSHEYTYCADVSDIKSAELMINWHAVDEILVVGSVVNLPLLAVIDYAKQLGAPIRQWQKPTTH